MPQGGSILCIDDEILLVMSLKLELSKTIPEDVSIVTAITREEARAVLDESVGESQRIRLLITDWIIPGITGGEFIDLARSRFPGLPVIVMTGISWKESIGPMILSQGPLEIVSKPWDSRKLALTVRTLLGCDIANPGIK